MSRALIDLELRTDGAAIKERRVERSTARAFAAAISALLISTLVITRSSSAFESEGTVASSTASAGSIALVDDDQGQSLFDLEDMAPNRPAERCITVTYDGTILPVELSLTANATGGLAPFLQTTVESGEGGSFGSCEGFVPDETLVDQDLRSLADGEPVVIDSFYNRGEARSFRITFTMADDADALAQTTTTGFIWEVTPL